ncbi:MAG: anion permease [Opitutales bacterium]|jgi:hypothetical protein
MGALFCHSRVAATGQPSRDIRCWGRAHGDRDIDTLWLSEALPLASTALLVPIFAAVAVNMSIPVTELILPLTLAASCAFMLPVATPPNAIVFGSGHIQQRDMVRIGLVLNLTFAVLLTVLSQILF